jgi:uncharacterized protein (DUF433 family)
VRAPRGSGEFVPVAGDAAAGRWTGRERESTDRGREGRGFACWRPGRFPVIIRKEKTRRRKDMNLPDFLIRDDDGEIGVTGTRIGLYHFLFYYNEGESAEQLALRYPHIPLATVHKVIAFYLESMAEVDQFLAEYDSKLDRLRAAGQKVNLVELRERLARIRTGTLSAENK